MAVLLIVLHSRISASHLVAMHVVVAVVVVEVVRVVSSIVAIVGSAVVV